MCRSYADWYARDRGLNRFDGGGNVNGVEGFAFAGAAHVEVDSASACGYGFFRLGS